LLAQLAAQHMGQYGQMAGAPGTEPMSRIKHTLQKAEIPRHLAPGAMPQRPQSGARTAMEMGKGLADLYKSGKEVKADLTKLLAEDKKPSNGTQGGTTTTTTSPAGGAPAAKTSGLSPDDSGRNMTASVNESASNIFDPFGRSASYNPKDVLDVAKLDNVGDSISDWGDSLLLSHGGRAHRAFGGGSGAGRLPSGLAPDGGIEIPDELPGYKLNEQVPKMGGSGGGGGGGPGQILNAAATLGKLALMFVKNGGAVRPHKYGGGGLGDVVDDVEYRARLERERGLNPLARAEDEPVRLAALSPTGTMSDAEPIGLGAGARVAQAATPTPPADVAPQAAAPKPAPVPAPVEEPKEEKRPSPVDRATQVASRYTEGPWEKLGEKAGVPASLRDERIIVPILAGLGSMLASDKPRFSQALGEGLAGAAGAYGAVRGQTQDIAEGQQREKLLGVQTAGARFKEFKDGRIMYLYNGDWIDMGKAYDLLEKGELKDIDYPTAERIRAEYRASQSSGERPSTPATPATPAAPAAPATSGPAGGSTEEKGAKPEAPSAPTTPSSSSVSQPSAASNLSPEDLEIANKWPKEAARQGPAWVNQQKDIYTPQQERASGARDFQAQFNPMAASLIGAPPTGLLATGALQSTLRPVVGYLNSLASTFGVEGKIKEEDFAKREEALKYIARLREVAIDKNDLRAVSALDAVAAGYPSDANSKKGIAKLLSGMQVETSREIDKNDYFQKFRDVAERGKITGGGPNRSGVFANLEERFARARAPMETKEKQGLERMYLAPAVVKRNGKELFYGQKGNLITEDDIARGKDRPMTWAEIVIKKGADLTPAQKNFIQSTFGYNPEKGRAPNILRHFGL